jgi:hypothetical protein|tara:strand:+ start:56 stop:481 length:426 start_codon:yes stop_codon:yes gene_type:complete
MYELKFEDKVKLWKDLRDKLETHPRPFSLLTQFTSTLKTSSRKDSPWDPKSVIQPWNLIENNSFTEYEIALLTCYTLQLTERFCQAEVEIHISKDIEKDLPMYLVYLDKSIVLGYKNEVLTINDIPEIIISQKTIVMPPLH